LTIKTWANADTKAIFKGESPRIVPASVARRAHRKLLILDAAKDLRDLRTTPGNRLEKLRGDRAGQFSIRINSQYRVCFVWRSGDAYQVEIVDYHR